MRSKRRTVRGRAALTAAVVALAMAAPAVAFQGLPAGAQVNDDAAAGINPTLGVGGEDPANADVVGGALTAGKVAVPWAIFRQHEAGSARDQAFVRSFASGAWTTRGTGTVGGVSSASPAFSGSLNFDQGQDGEAPSIDFAGAGRTVPWATWYENTAAFSATQIFASRFDNTGDANQGKWIFSGPSRGNGTGTVPVPSLNIHTDQDAENPAVAGGTTVAGTDPGPWFAWQETDTLPTPGKNQIFVDKPSAPGQTSCTGDTPSSGTPIGGFCFQDVGVPRAGASAADPSLNVDPTRNGIEPDIAFTGVSDTVPWVVWYETGSSSAGLNNNEMVFAARAVADASANGGFEWEAIGGAGSGALDTAGASSFGACAASAAAEEGCSLNNNGTANAEDPQVASGTMTAGNTTAPWVTWDETLNGVQQVFVSRLVSTPTPHFELANNGAPISTGSNDSTRPAITFSGNTPYVTWREDVGGGVVKAFVGHFVNAANPTFVLDESDTALTPTAQAAVREPISSGCTGNSFDADGSSCQGAAIGTPFFLFTAGTSPTSLFADAYAPTTPSTGGASAITDATAAVAGSVDPDGASTSVFFQYGTSTSYGSSTSPQTLGPDDATDAFTGSLSGLPAKTVIHYRAVATTDFGTVDGPDQTLTTAATPPPTSPGPTPRDGAVKIGKRSVSGTTARAKVTCSGAAGAMCKVTLEITVTETVQGHKLIAVAAVKKRKKHKKVVVLAKATVTLSEGQSKVVNVSLGRAGKGLLRKHHTLPTKLVAIQTLINKRARTVSSQAVTFKQRKPRKGALSLAASSLVIGEKVISLIDG